MVAMARRCGAADGKHRSGGGRGAVGSGGVAPAAPQADGGRGEACSQAQLPVREQV